MARHSAPKDKSINIACSHLLSPKNFLIWRAVIAFYFWIVFIWSQIEYNIHTEFFGKTLIYLTIWTLIICTIYMSFALYASYIHYQSISIVPSATNTHHIRCSRYCYYAEKFQIFATSLSVTVVLAFWILLSQYANTKNPLEVQIHGTTAMFTIIDFYLCYSVVSFRSTFWYLIVFSCIYAIWSIMYQFISDEAIYPVLDWKQQPFASAITTICVIVLAVGIHFFLCWSNRKLLKRIGYKLEDASQFLAFDDSQHDAEVSKDKSIADDKKYGTQQQMEIAITK
eukprot:185782_1